MRFQILGPLRVEVDGREVPITARRDRVLLGVLLLYANQPMSVDQLIDAVWPGRPPRNARNQLQGCVSRLRKQLAMAGLGDRVIVTEPSGYRMVVDPGDLDLLEFRRLATQARAAAAGGCYEQAVDGYRGGLALWRGSVLAGVDGHTIPQVAAGLDEERTRGREERIDAELAAGAGGKLVAELTELVRQHPHREGLHRALMLALYRAGRQADALSAYRHARQLLSEELGTEPGPELQELHQAILQQKPSLIGRSPTRRQSPDVRVPRQLPSDVGGFAGRDDALKALDELMAHRHGETGPVVISAIAGTAGVGKTALAVHWAHRVAKQFPDGQLCVNLRGFDPRATPVEPASAMRGLLDGLQVPPERVPTSLDAQINLYRSLLVERRVLILLDNARDAEQVRPLLPGAPGCLVLVTSRNRLSGLVATDGAVPLPIGVLPDDEARQLLAARLGGERVAAEPDSVADLVAVCDGLPLALAIVAARAAARPAFPLSVVAEEVHQAGAGLEPWTSSDAATDLRAVFSSSYRALDPAAARLFRLVGLHPGPDLAASAAASLAAVSPQEAHRLLTRLTEANLIVEHAPGRFTLHDLLRAYAAELTSMADAEPYRQAALHRLLDHYLHIAYKARELRDPHQRITFRPSAPQPGSELIGLDTYEQAIAWLTTEQPVLLSAIDFCAKSGFDAHAWQLAGCLAMHLSRRGYWAEWLTIQRAALSAAQRLGDGPAEAHAHAGVGGAFAVLGSHELARQHIERALALFAEFGEQYWQAHCHHNLSVLAHRRGDHRRALVSNQRAHELFRRADDRAGQARALNGIAVCYSLLGDHQLAITHGEEALAIHQEVGNLLEEGAAWDSLGHFRHQLGEHRRAIAFYQRALALLDRVDYPHGRAETLHHLGDAHHSLGGLDAAQLAWQAALDILQQLDHPEAEVVRAKLDQPAGG
jgi:DNA-binding SARP family transcriptional activator/tetratricopeptide (TPR) repeat protein